MRNALVLVFLVGCGATSWRSQATSRSIVLVARAEQRVTLGIAILRPDGAVATTQMAEPFDPDDLVIRDRWCAGPGTYRLVIGWIGPNRVPFRVNVPLPIRGSERMILVSADEAVRVLILDPAWGITAELVEMHPLEFRIRNESDRPIQGIGFPSGHFDGELVQLAPITRIVPSPRGYCGTGAFARGPLQPGDSTASGPSAFAMSDERRALSEGDYVWITTFAAEGWSASEWSSEAHGVPIDVVRLGAAFVRFRAP